MAKATVTVYRLKVVKATAKALLVAVEGWNSDVWLPKSQLLPGTEIKEQGDVGKAVIPEWLAGEKGFGEALQEIGDDIQEDDGPPPFDDDEDQPAF